MTKPRVSFLMATLAFFLWASAASGGDTTEVFTAGAFNKRGELEYTENHAVSYENEKVTRSRTLYFDPAGRMIGELVSEYLPSPQFNTYSFKDSRAGYEDGVSVEGERLRLFRKKSPGANQESAYLRMAPDQVVGQGFHHFLRLNLETLATGEIFHIKLVMPSRLDQYNFRIRKVKRVGQTLHIRLEIDNWFLRIFAPYVECEYELGTRRLLRYVGISNLEDGSGSHPKVDIVYTYQN
jgi:hypothetical protein